MKQIYRAFWLIVLLPAIGYSQAVSPCLIAAGIVRQPCPAGTPASLETPLYAGIPKQIARSFNAEGLSSWITPGKCWGWLAAEGASYDESNLPPDETPVNCAPPYDRCFGNYCPEKYAQVIRSMADLKASIILRAVNTWGRYGSLKPGTAFYQGMKQLVTDIHGAYDCRGLKRPVIQGTIFEHIDENVATVPIPAAVIAAYKGEPGFERKYYLDAQGNARTDLLFRLDRIRNNRAKLHLSDCPDITRIEARMWFDYLARLYIDLGYTSIHMGQLHQWGRSDAPGYKHTAATLAAIRAYAQSKQTFVLLTEENFRALKQRGSETFLFDYDSRALRIRELSTPQVCGDYNCSNTPVNYLAQSACAAERFPAVIDECVVSAQGNTGGYYPISNTYTPYLPYNTYFDFGPGNYADTGRASSGCDPDPDWGTWGWDDTKWFALKIGQPCRAFWMGDAIQRLRQYHNGFGFMSAPGLLAISMPENGNRHLRGDVHSAGAAYLLSDEVTVEKTIQDRWRPGDSATITIDRVCSGDLGPCPGGDNTMRQQSATYTFKVQGYDQTTVYTWHIQNPDGSWQPHTYGLTRSFTAPADGWYSIYLRQDNLGQYSNGSTVKTDSIRVRLSRYCCPGRQSNDPKQGHD